MILFNLLHAILSATKCKQYQQWMFQVSLFFDKSCIFVCVSDWNWLYNVWKSSPTIYASRHTTLHCFITRYANMIHFDQFFHQPICLHLVLAVTVCILFCTVRTTVLRFFGANSQRSLECIYFFQKIEFSHNFIKTLFSFLFHLLKI